VVVSTGHNVILALPPPVRPSVLYGLLAWKPNA